ncbi:MAG: insulinase family protein [Clostridia bacterium]|nr:insulinase family protein [Clostridia bacterium]
MTIETRESRFGDRYDVIRHPSGLTIYVYPKEGWNSTYAVFGTDYGSVDVKYRRSDSEKPETIPAGTAHFLEHKLFESEDQDAFARFAALGASANAYTSFENTSYLFSCTENVYESLEVLLDFVQSPYFTKESVEKEFGIIGQEIDMYEDDPQWRVMFNLLGALYHTHPIRVDIAGTQESIREITPECLHRCYDTFYNLNHMVLSVAGCVETQKVLDVCDRILRPNPPVTVQRLFDEEPRHVVRERVEQPMSVAIPLFQLGFKCDSALKKDEKLSAAADVLLEILASDASVLFRKMSDAGVISDSSFGYEFFEGNGFAMVLFSGESNDPDAACTMILEEIERMRREGISAEDFERARRSVYGSNISAFNSVESIATSLMMFSFKEYELFRYIDAVAALTLEDVTDCMQQILDPAHRAVSVICPITDEE